MTAAKFLTFTLIALFITTVVKVFFITTLNIESWYIVYVMWLAIGLVTIACIRRVGVINYIESVFVLAVWIFFSMFLDLLILYPSHMNMYHKWYLWGCYITVGLCVFLFHKKRHVEIRRKQREEAVKQAPKAHH